MRLLWRMNVSLLPLYHRTSSVSMLRLGFVSPKLGHPSQSSILRSARRGGDTCRGQFIAAVLELQCTWNYRITEEGASLSGKPISCHWL